MRIPYTVYRILQKYWNVFSAIRYTLYAVRPGASRGFSLIELLAVTAVIAIISGVLLISNSRFGGSVLLENLAYDIALTVRQAQVYGISVQRFGTNTFSAAYGVHFDTSSASSQTTFVTFADAGTADGLYDQPGTSELVQATSLERGFRIAKLCTPAGANLAACTTSGNPGVSVVDIVFKRPEPDAWISTGSQSCTLGNGACQQSVRIVISSPRGDLTSIVVENNGQISVAKQ